MVGSGHCQLLVLVLPRCPSRLLRGLKHAEELELPDVRCSVPTWLCCEVLVSGGSAGTATPPRLVVVFDGDLPNYGR